MNSIETVVKGNITVVTRRRTQVFTVENDINEGSIHASCDVNET